MRSGSAGCAVHDPIQRIARPMRHLSAMLMACIFSTAAACGSDTVDTTDDQGAGGGDGGGGSGGGDAGAAGGDGTDVCDDGADAIARCKQKAEDVGTCAEVGDCACDNCNCELAKCETDADCVAIRGCAQEKDCVSVACYAPETCMDVIDEHGGIGGSGVALGTALSTCIETAACPVSCP